MSDRSARWVIASQNPSKQREIQQIFRATGIEIEGLARHRDVTFPEEGLDYRDNAIGKARAVANQFGEIAVADDSGIEVDALNGAPGPLSARYGGAGLGDPERVARMLSAMSETPPKQRTARFVCYAALATPAGDTLVAFGECKGSILVAPTGEGGFGYDPIFRPDGFSESMGELAPAVKNRISHRAEAFLDLYARWLASPYPEWGPSRS